MALRLAERDSVAAPDVRRLALLMGLVLGVAALVGLAGVVVGGLALARSAGRIGTGSGRRGAVGRERGGRTGSLPVWRRSPSPGDWALPALGAT